MDDEPTLGSQGGPEGARRVRLWPRLFALAFLTVVVLLALGGTSKASELDPIGTVTETVVPVDATVTDTVDPVVETVAGTVEPVVEKVTHKVDQVVDTVTDTVDPIVDTVDPIVEPVTGAVDTVVETVRVAVPEPTDIVGTGDVDTVLPLLGRASSRVIVADLRPSGVLLGGPAAEASSFGVSGVQPAGAATDEGSSGGPNGPLGGGGAGQSLTLLILVAALTTSLRAFRPPILSSIVPRAVAMHSAALALSVERPG